MKRLVPALLALLAGCGEPTIPDRLGLEVGQEISVTYPAAYISTESNMGSAMGLYFCEIQQVSGDWVQVRSGRGDINWANLRLAAYVTVKEVLVTR